MQSARESREQRSWFVGKMGAEKMSVKKHQNHHCRMQEQCVNVCKFEIK